MKNISFLKMLDYPFSPKKWFRKEYKSLLFNGTKNEIPLPIKKEVEKILNLSEIAEDKVLDIRLLLG